MDTPTVAMKPLTSKELSGIDDRIEKAYQNCSDDDMQLIYDLTSEGRFWREIVKNCKTHLDEYDVCIWTGNAFMECTPDNCPWKLAHS